MQGVSYQLDHVVDILSHSKAGQHNDFSANFCCSVIPIPVPAGLGMRKHASKLVFPIISYIHV